MVLHLKEITNVKMNPTKTAFTTIDDYIATFPASTQTILQQLRTTIQAAAPAATEKISYQMPTFALKGNLVHFAAYPHHVGFYPTPSGIETFAEELAIYKSAKGSVQFPLDEPLPLELISRIVAFRVAENLQKAAEKAHKKK
jgi:uncharacterized protein YdhG (YjbR/CyaY superfamily)